MFDIKVIDNFFSQEAYNSLKLRLDRDIEWRHSHCITGHTGLKELDIYAGGFGKIIQRDDESEEKKDLYPEFTHLFGYKLTETFHLEKILRIRAGLQVPINQTKVNDPHVDYDYPHWTALVYFCSEDDAGYTYFYNEFWDKNSYANPYVQWQENKDLFKLADKIAPKENRCVIFRGDMFHASSAPETIARRLAVNVNFKGNPKHGTETDRP